MPLNKSLRTSFVQCLVGCWLTLFSSSDALRYSDERLEHAKDAVNALGREIAQQVLVEALNGSDFTFASMLHGDKASDPGRVPRHFLEYLNHNMGFCGELKVTALHYGVATLGFRGHASLDFAWSGAMNEMEDDHGDSVRSSKSVSLGLGGTVEAHFPFFGHLRFALSGKLEVGSPNAPSFVDLIGTGFGALIYRSLSRLGSLATGRPTVEDRRQQDVQELEMALQANYGASKFHSREFLWAEFVLRASELIYLQLWSFSMALTWARPSRFENTNIKQQLSHHVWQLARAISQAFFNGQEKFITASCSKADGVNFVAQNLVFEECPFGRVTGDGNPFFCYPAMRNGQKLQLDEKWNLRDSTGQLVVHATEGDDMESFRASGLPAQRMCRVLQALGEVDPEYAKVKNVSVTITSGFEETGIDKFIKFFGAQTSRTFTVPPHIYAVAPRMFDKLLTAISGNLSGPAGEEMLNYLQSFDEVRIRQEAGTWLKIFWDELDTLADSHQPVPVNEEIDEGAQVSTWGEVRESCAQAGDQARDLVATFRKDRGFADIESAGPEAAARLREAELATIRCAAGSVVSPLLRYNIGGTVRALLEEVRREEHHLSAMELNTAWTGTVSLQADQAMTPTFVACALVPANFLKVTGAFSYAFKGVVDSSGKMVYSKEAMMGASFSFAGYVMMPTVTFLKGIGYTYSGCTNKLICPQFTGTASHTVNFNLEVPQEPWMKGDKLGSAGGALVFEAVAQDMAVHIRNFRRTLNFEGTKEELEEEQSTGTGSVPDQAAQKSLLQRSVDGVKDFFTEIPNFLTTAHLVAPLQTAVAMLDPTLFSVWVKVSNSYEHGHLVGPTAISFGLSSSNRLGTNKVPQWLRAWSVSAVDAFFTSGVTVDLSGILIDGLRTPEGKKITQADAAAER
ncbi:unnamed protein product [Effrenium voratum]|uniref:Uncharacterized protein n=1 Tax=Effrenium voratum TaxID=2562239 RepID=A0AA36JQ34_9DINO|nr:unnamed protein product [Effrenium voratum]